MRDMEDRMTREASGYQDTIARLEADIAKMKVIIFIPWTYNKGTVCVCMGFYS